MNMVASLPRNMESAPKGRPLGIFAINLDRSPDRWSSIERHFGNLSWPLHRVAGVDARLDPQAVLSVRGVHLQFPPNGVALNSHRNRVFMLTEEACLAGHVLAWRQFLASDFEHALVLEDDAEPQSGFADVVAALLTQGFSADVVKLEGIYRPGGRRVLPMARLGDWQLVRSLRPVSGAAAYLVTRPAAEQLLARVGTAMIPADDFLWAPSWHGLRVADVAPFIVMQSGAESVIATDLAAKQSMGGRSVWRSFTTALQRCFERVGLLLAACEGRPRKLLNTTMAPWAPDVYNLGNRTAATAEDRRSSNG